MKDNQALISQIIGVVSLLGEKLDFFSPLGFEARSDFGHKPPNIEIPLVAEKFIVEAISFINDILQTIQTHIKSLLILVY